MPLSLGDNPEFVYKLRKTLQIFSIHVSTSSPPPCPTHSPRKLAMSHLKPRYLPSLCTWSREAGLFHPGKGPSPPSLKIKSNYKSSNLLLANLDSLLTLSACFNNSNH